jgi:shikimate dehydrogenase
MTKRYAVIGDPVSHSLSPLMHSGWIADHGLNATYEAYQLRSDDPVAAIRGLTKFDGMNVTVPHKKAAAKAADAGAFRVANTLRREKDGSLSAFNTDGDGFLDALTEALPDWGARVSDVLILGAGGAAEGIIDALHPAPKHDIRFIIANRTRERAEGLAESRNFTDVGDWNDLGPLFERADLIVQTTALGMSDAPIPEWPVHRCKRDAIIVDIVYRPLETPLLRAARAEGLTAIDGLGMLIHQGARSFEIWHGIKPDTAKARARLEAALT